MKNNIIDIILNVNHQLEALFNKHKLNIISDNSSEMVLYYCGLISEGVIQQLAEKLEAKLLENGERKVVIKKMFNALIEAIQNIENHGYIINDEEVCVGLLVSVAGNQYRVDTYNLIRNDQIDNVSRKIEFINSLDKDQLKTYYLDILNKGEFSSKGGAGLGLITIARKSGYEIEKTFSNEEDQASIFQMTYRIDSKIQ